MKSEMKIKIFLGVILTIATLISFNALILTIATLISIDALMSAVLVCKSSREAEQIVYAASGLLEKSTKATHRFAG